MPSPEPHLAWLYEQLPALQGKGVITAETAQRLREHFGEVKAEPRGVSWAMVLFGVIGAALIGSGIILILAHNWDDMGRPTRAVVAFLPLLVSLGLGAWIIATDRLTTAWREGVGTFQALAVVACLGLVSQTYHLGGNFGVFCLVCSLLVLPIAYLLRSTLPAMAYGAGIVVWLFERPWWSWWWHRGEDRLVFWALLAALLPLWWSECRKNAASMRTVLIGWTIAIAGSVAWIAVLDSGRQEYAESLVLTGWFAFLYFVAARFERTPGRPFWRRPLQLVGFGGSVWMAVLLSFAIHDHDLHSGTQVWTHVVDFLKSSPLGWLAAYGWWVAALVLWALAWKERRIEDLILGALPLMAALEINDTALSKVIAIGFNAYVLAIAVLLITRGIREQRLGVVNAGMATLTALVIARFFDSDMSMIVRAIVFIVLGIGFLTTNMLLLRRKRQPSS